MIKKTLISIVAVLASLMVIAPSIANQREYAGAVYVMTNDPDDNEIAVYSRNADGLLVLEEYYSTGGLGSGGDGVDPLVSQESLILSPNKRWLIAVNAAAIAFRCFAFGTTGLNLRQKPVPAANFR